MGGALEFLIMLNPLDSIETLIVRLRDQFSDAAPVHMNSLRLRGNLCELWSSAEYDPRALKDPEEGYLYYPGRLEITPLQDGIDEDHQVRLAIDLAQCFRSWGYEAVVCAAFEARVDGVLSH